VSAAPDELGGAVQTASEAGEAAPVAPRPSLALLGDPSAAACDSCVVPLP
jgi:hypothetical protein